MMKIGFTGTRYGMTQEQDYAVAKLLSKQPLTPAQLDERRGIKMTSRDFCFWLQGYLEIGSALPEHVSTEPQPCVVFNQAQVRVIKNHLNLVFKHEIDPSYGGNQEELNEAHEGKKKKHQIGGTDSHGNIVRC